MCGIAGVVGNVEERVIDEMLSIQKHRGPDNTSSWNDNGVELGHNRLSIIDLSAEANQPLENDSYVLIFNGEIYNYLEIRKELVNDYTFKTNSDTEVLLAAYQKWGKHCLDRLNGMFAFAVWNKKEKKLFGARDRFGVKPFFYNQNKNKLTFASEIKTIHASGVQKELNKQVWATYFTHGSYGMPDQTFWEDIFQLPAGHYLEYSNKQLQIHKWYFFEKEIEKYQQEHLTYEEVKIKYTALLKDSIKLRFRADVPIGFNVSGGLDSSALLAFVNKYEGKENIEAFTFYTADDRYDELPWVEEMLSITNNPLNKVLLNVEEIEELANTISHQQDEPFGGVPTLAYAKIFKRAREKGILVLLDGQGMDEQWAGYDYYLSNTKNVIQGVKKSPFKRKVLSEELLNNFEAPKYPEPFEDDLLNKQYRDLFYTKIPRALRFNDRISMTFGTELREPFLDYRLVEFAFAQPKEYKIKDGVQKKLLRDIVAEYLSDTISYAPKRPLQTPQREWLASELKEFVESRIIKLKTSKYKNWFNFVELDKEWDNYKNGDNDSSFHIWQWISLSFLIND